MHKARIGFTLVEIMIVVLIIGILAAIAIPQFANFRERAKATEAVQTIGVIKNAEDAYYSTNNSFYISDAPDWNKLGVRPPTGGLFTYELSNSLPSDGGAPHPCVIIAKRTIGEEEKNLYLYKDTSAESIWKWGGDDPGTPPS